MSRRPVITRKSAQGSVMLEFALGFTLVVPLLLGLFQFSYTFFLYNQLTTAIRAGGRYAATRIYDSRTETPTAAFTTAVRNMVVFGSPEGGTTPVVPGLTPSQVRVRMEFEQNAPSHVVVDIDDFTINNLIKPYLLSGKPRAVFSYFGRWAPL
jgi:Flp pilus assembly protein TadG